MTILAMAMFAMHTMVARALLVIGQNLFWRSLGVFMYGHAFYWSAFNPRLSNIRATLHLPSMRAFRLSATLYVLAGLIMLVAAVTRLEAAFTSIVAVACIAWIAAWSYAIVRTWNEVEPTVERSIP